MTGRRAAMPNAVGAALSCAEMGWPAPMLPAGECDGHVHVHRCVGPPYPGTHGGGFSHPQRGSPCSPGFPSSLVPRRAHKQMHRRGCPALRRPHPAGTVAARAQSARATRSTPCAMPHACSDRSRLVTASSIPGRQQGSARQRHTGGGGEAGEELGRPPHCAPLATHSKRTPCAMHAPTASNMSGETATQCEKKHMDGDGMKSTSASMTKLDKRLPTTHLENVVAEGCWNPGGQSVSNVLRRQGDWPTKSLQLVERRNVYGEAIRNGQLGTRSAVDAVGGVLGVCWKTAGKSKALLSRRRWYVCVGYTLTSRHLSTDGGSDRKFTLQASRTRQVFDRASCGEVAAGCLYGTLPQSQS
jgi:hypothetical protein